MIQTVLLSILFIPCIITDIKKYEIPVGYTAMLGFTALGYRIITATEVKATLITAVMFTCLFLIFSLLSRGIGAGDAFLTGSAICVFGFYTALKGILLGMIITALSGGACMLIKKDKHLKLPFAPFLISGIILGKITDILQGGI